MLEELLALGHRGAEYDAWLIRIGEGDQFGSGFCRVAEVLDRSRQVARSVATARHGPDQAVKAAPDHGGGLACRVAQDVRRPVHPAVGPLDAGQGRRCARGRGRSAAAAARAAAPTLFRHPVQATGNGFEPGRLGHPVGVMAMTLAVDKALAHGMGGVGVFNSHHFGAAGVYARLAADRGVLGMVASSARSVVMVPTRGAAPVLGTNPLAFSAPARRNRPFVLDMATTTVAANKVKVYDLNRKPLPEGWVVDERGRPVTDAALAMDYLFKRPEGGLTPLGGAPEMGSHKGYGLAMMAKILGATLTGGSFSPLRNRDGTRPDEPDNIGHFFLAIDPKAFRHPARSRTTWTRPSTCCTRRRPATRPSRCWWPASRRTSRACGGCGRASRSRPRWTAISATFAAAAAPSTCSRTPDKARPLPAVEEEMQDRD